MNTPNDNRKNIPQLYPPSAHKNTDYGDGYTVHHKKPVEVRVNGRKLKPYKKKSTPGKIFKILLIILLIILLSFSIYIALVVFRINYSSESPDHENTASSVGELKSDSEVENIMIFGADNHPDDEYGRSDSVILLSLDKRNGKIKLTSFLRDLYVTIPGHSPDRLNAAFAYGGAKLASETIEYNFRIKTDCYIVVDFSGFTSIIDAMGGIDLELTAEEIDYINWQSWRNKQVETRNEITVPESSFHSGIDGDEQTATVHLNGRQALWYARDRDSAGSDFDRTARQRIVIETILSKLKSANVFTLMSVAFQAAPLITTNMSKAEVIGKLFSVIGILRYDKEEYRVPRSDNFSFKWIEGASVLGIDDEEYEINMLYKFIYG